MAQRSFKLDDDLDARLVAEAKRQGRSVSNLIVWALVRELGNAERDSGFVVVDKTANSFDQGDQLVAEAKRLRNREALGSPPAFEGTPLPKIAPRKKR